MSKSGQVLLSEIVGSVKMRVKLTGMPELRLGLNDKVLFENTGSKSLTITLIFHLGAVAFHTNPLNEVAGVSLMSIILSF